MFYMMFKLQNQGVQRRMVLMDIFFVFLNLNFFGIVAICDLVHEVPSLTANSMWRSFLISYFRKRFPHAVSS